MRRKTVPEVTRKLAIESIPVKGPTMFSKTWLIDTIERAVKTAAQASLGAGIVGATDLLSVNWVGALSVGGLAAVISVLTSAASEPVGNGGTASATRAVEATPQQ